jgi:RNA polymerase sigma-32 factor
MQWQDWLEDEDANQAQDLEERDEFEARRELLLQAMATLNERERDILTKRRLSDDVTTLEDLSANTSQPRTHPPDRSARV